MELVQVQMESMEPTELMESTEMFEGKLRHDVINQCIQLSKPQYRIFVDDINNVIFQYSQVICDFITHARQCVHSSCTE